MRGRRRFADQNPNEHKAQADRHTRRASVEASHSERRGDVHSHAQPHTCDSDHNWQQRDSLVRVRQAEETIHAASGYPSLPQAQEQKN